jgi:hypothetical protein
MNDLFTLYRYLATNSDKNDTSNPYTTTLAALEHVLDLITYLEGEGCSIRNGGDIEWDHAIDITQQIVDVHKNALCANAVSPLEAAIDFVQTRLSLQDIDTFIEALQVQKLQEQAAMDDNDLGDLDDHPF